MKILNSNREFQRHSFYEFFLPDHVVLIGENNTEKSLILEAIDLVLGLTD